MKQMLKHHPLSSPLLSKPNNNNSNTTTINGGISTTNTGFKNYFKTLEGRYNFHPKKSHPSTLIHFPHVSVQWKRLSTSNEGPPARAYHTMTLIGSRYLLFGGFDGKSTFSDFWWLVPEDDPISKRSAPSLPESLHQDKEVDSSDPASVLKERQHHESAISELQTRLKSFPSFSSYELQILDEANDKELHDLALKLMEGRTYNFDVISQTQEVQMLRDYWRNAEPDLIELKHLGPLLRDYQRLIKHRLLDIIKSEDNAASMGFVSFGSSYQFYHMKDASQLRMDDIRTLLAEYKQLLAN